MSTVGVPMRITTSLLSWAVVGTSLLALQAATGAAVAAPLVTGSDSIKLLFAGGVDPSTGLLKGSPALAVQFPGGSPQNFIMDTGSAGMVVYGGGFTPPSGATPLVVNAVQAYKSDNLEFTGNVYATDVQIGLPGHSVTATVPVLYATSQSCAQGSSCSPVSSLKFMGVGFGQAAVGNTNWFQLDTTARNPLFNITAINGVPADPTHGWIMSSMGITVGLTDSNIQAFDPAGLEMLSTSADGFNRGSAAVVASATGDPLPPMPSAFTGTVLVDSGVRYAMLQLESGSTRPPTIACPGDASLSCTDAGTTLSIFLGNPAAPLVYQVITGTGGTPTAAPNSAAAPDFVNQLAESPQPFWNTSYHFYNAYNYLFDAESGYVGYATAANTASVPGPLPPAALAGLLAWSRKLRRRCGVVPGPDAVHR